MDVNPDNTRTKSALTFLIYSLSTLREDISLPKKVKNKNKNYGKISNILMQITKDKFRMFDNKIMHQ